MPLACALARRGLLIRPAPLRLSGLPAARLPPTPLPRLPRRFAPPAALYVTPAMATAAAEAPALPLPPRPVNAPPVDDTRAMPALSDERRIFNASATICADGAGWWCAGGAGSVCLQAPNQKRQEGQ